MLQLLHLNVSKVDRMLLMGCAWEAASGVDNVRGGMGDAWGDVGPLLVHSLTSSTR
jgi:hypothetical protein